MDNIMVCVTKQKTCQRLIDYGKKIMASDEDSIHVVHVSGLDYHFLGDSEDGKALEFLYERAREAGANLTVLKSDDVLETLVDTIDENHITKVVVGESREEEGYDGFLEKLQKRIKGKAEMQVVPVTDTMQP